MAEGTAMRWEDEMPRYRARWERRHAEQGGRWDESEPDYRYGWEMSNEPRYRGRPWDEVESPLRRDWEARHPDRPWDRAADAIREAWAGDANSGTGDVEQRQTVELREEELHTRKQMVETGAVEIRKEVITEMRTIEVPVTREELVIERHPAGQAPDRPAGEGETIRVPLREEQVTIEKRPVAYEEVEVGKRQVQDTELVSREVRREVADLEQRGDIDVRGWEEARAGYQQDWERRVGASGGRWEDVEPGYRYTHEMRNDPHYREREWDEAEPDLRSGYGEWSRRSGHRAAGDADNDDAWERLRDDVRAAWEQSRGVDREE